MKHTKAEMLANCVSQSERRRIDLTVPDDTPTGGSMQSARDFVENNSESIITEETDWIWDGEDERGITALSFDTEKLIALIRFRDKEIVKAVINIFDKRVYYDPHGHDNPDGSRDGICHCTDQLRTELQTFMEDVSQEIL